MVGERNGPYVFLLFEEFPCVTQPFVVEAAEGLLREGLLAAVFSARRPRPEERAKLKVSRLLRKKIHYLPRGYLRYTVTGRVLLDFTHACLVNPHILISLFKTVIRRHPRPLRALLAMFTCLPMTPYLKDILHIESSWLAQTYSYLLEIPELTAIVTFRGRDIAVRPLFDPKWVDFLQNSLFPKAARLHFVCKSLAEKAKSYGASDEKCFVVHQGIGNEFFAVERRPAESAPLIVSVGRLVWEKGYEYAVEAAALLKARGRAFHLTLIGEGPMRAPLHFLIRHRKLQNEVTLAGALGPEKVREHLSRATLLLCSSVSEGMPTMLMEAQAAGLPIITTNVGGVPECVEDGITAFCVPPYDARALAEKIEFLMDNSELARKMGEAGRERARRLFRVEREIDDWIEICQDVIRKGAAS